ncbi:winged helix-turn-helix domain-containing protein [Paraferrimonas haliotis]|nr:winged helix-turn-helix domain-containing protein [Paraferrimonas haliotis]
MHNDINVDINQFTFDPSANGVVNRETGTKHSLTPTEYQVMTFLCEHPNQVFNKQQLACAGGLEPIMSDSAVVKAVFTLRKYLDDHDAIIIETIPRKGYRLNIEMPDTSFKPRHSHLLQFCFVPSIVIALLASIAIMHKYIWFDVPQAPNLDKQILTLSNEQTLTLHWLPYPAHAAPIKRQVQQRLMQRLSTCEPMIWNHVYLTFSADAQVFNLSLVGKTPLQEMVVKNIKNSDFSAQPLFLSPNWIDEVNLCE